MWHERRAAKCVLEGFADVNEMLQPLPKWHCVVTSLSLSFRFARCRSALLVPRTPLL